MKIENQEQAEAALRALSEYYKEPVMPVGRYCGALRTWAECIEVENGLREATPSHAPRKGQGARYADVLYRILIDISKSNLLGRLIYKRQKLRTVPCPEHKGHWSGCSPEPCPHGCSDDGNITGWLPEP